MTHPKDPPARRQTADPIPQLCCHCGQLTRQPVQVDEAASPSGPVPLYACPADVPLFASQQERAS